ncbi:hypothetical protein MRB53_026906 [Persea americana]|uniref:Uncharacterized protein n=1 Tax=Persea americana TaxID=3435 RepID=A0ACC2LJD5_PERAE|nr:hypothetical protein MRB53_026906 [Persea americana]
MAILSSSDRFAGFQVLFFSEAAAGAAFLWNESKISKSLLLLILIAAFPQAMSHRRKGAVAVSKSKEKCQTKMWPTKLFTARTAYRKSIHRAVALQPWTYAPCRSSRLWGAPRGNTNDAIISSYGKRPCK